MPIQTEMNKETPVNYVDSPLERGKGELCTKLPLESGKEKQCTKLPLEKGSNRRFGGYNTNLSEILNSKYIIKANAKLTPRAKYMSRNMTKAEQILWFNLLAKRQLLGYRFTKQKQVFNYILDFYCSELLLAIEVDGDSHSIKQEYDQARTKFLNSINIKVIRTTNDEIYKNLEGVYTFLKSEIVQIKKSNND